MATRRRRCTPAPEDARLRLVAHQRVYWTASSTAARLPSGVRVRLARRRRLVGVGQARCGRPQLDFGGGVRPHRPERAGRSCGLIAARSSHEGLLLHRPRRTSPLRRCSGGRGCLRRQTAQKAFVLDSSTGAALFAARHRHRVLEPHRGTSTRWRAPRSEPVVALADIAHRSACRAASSAARWSVAARRCGRPPC